MQLKEITIKIGDTVLYKPQKTIWRVTDWDSYRVQMEWNGNLATRVWVTWKSFTKR